MDRHLSRNELATNAKAGCRSKPKQMVASPELFGAVVSPDLAYQTAGEHPKRIMIDCSTEADERIANTGMVRQSRSLFGECTMPKEDRQDRIVFVQLLSEHLVVERKKRNRKTKMTTKVENEAAFGRLQKFGI